MIVTQTFDEQNTADTLVDEPIFYLWALLENKIVFGAFFGKNSNDAINLHLSGSVSLNWQNTQYFPSLDASHEINIFYIKAGHEFP